MPQTVIFPFVNSNQSKNYILSFNLKSGVITNNAILDRSLLSVRTTSLASPIKGGTTSYDVVDTILSQGWASVCLEYP